MSSYFDTALHTDLWYVDAFQSRRPSGARLCSSCRNTELVEYDSVIPSCLRRYSIIPASRTIKPLTYDIFSKGYSFRRDTDAVEPEITKFLDAKDARGLKKWGAQKNTDMNIYNRDSKLLVDYLLSEKDARTREENAIKTRRRQTIIERLDALGWKPSDFAFEGKSRRPGMRIWTQQSHLQTARGVPFCLSSRP